MTIDMFVGGLLILTMVAVIVISMTSNRGDGRNQNDDLD